MQRAPVYAQILFCHASFQALLLLLLLLPELYS